MVDVDAALAAMRQLLGSGQAPQWPQPEFGQPVPPAAQWDGDASDRAQQVSQQLDHTRQGLADVNTAVPPIIEHVAQINSDARAELDNIEQQWHADQAAYAPIANTPAGQLALTQLGQLRISEGTAVIQKAQAAFASAASQIQALTGQLPIQIPTKVPAQGPQPGPDDTIVGPDGRPVSGTPHVKPADFGRGEPPETPAMVDPHNPLIGDERFGHWEQYTPLPYTGATPPPPPPEHRSLEGLPAKTGGPSGFYTPGRTWITDDQAPAASMSEEYKFRISGEDLTSYTRTAMVNGQPQLQRWAANTYESQRITQVNLGGPAWSKTDPNALEGTLGGVTTGGLAGITPPPFFGKWESITPQQISGLSGSNPTVKYYIPDGCGGQFTFQGGVPVGGMAPPPMPIPIMTAPR